MTEYHFKVQENDLFIAMSDGVVHAGRWNLNLGWQWTNIAQYIEKVSKVEHTTGAWLSYSTATMNFYMDKPGDDATIAALE